LKCFIYNNENIYLKLIKRETVGIGRQYFGSAAICRSHSVGLTGVYGKLIAGG